MNESVTTAVDEASSIDSSYAATYFPWVRVRDIGSNKGIYVPPSVIVPQAYAYNDRVGEEWFAPAGINRGGLGGAIDTRYRLYKADWDTLTGGGGPDH
jgi:Bacteriophage tail sheath protein